MKHLNRITDRIQRRFRSARPGSVLILVVALLVLMALLGTAFISSARTDRYGAAQHAINTEIDLLIEGMVNQAVATITRDLYGSLATPGSPLIYRPGTPALQVQPYGYEHHDSTIYDLWLADRLPVVENVNEESSATLTSDQYPMFRAISFPLAFNNAAGTGYQFDRPDSGTPLALPVGGVLPRSGYSFKPGTGTVAGQAGFPYLLIRTSPGATPVAMPAADADGDGIADAGMWKIPVGTIDGITYYAAFRIIDHGSAINLNTALSRTRDFTASGATSPNLGFFTGNVGLAELLKTWAPAGTTITTMGAEFDALNRYRFHTPTAATYAPPSGLVGGTGDPIADDGTARPDFKFFTVADALQHQLGRRILNPGMSTATALDRFKPFGFADQAALAYRFCLVNLEASPSPLEQWLISETGTTPGTAPIDSIYESAPNYVNAANRFARYNYSSAHVKDWFDAIADHRAEAPSPPGTPAAPTAYLNRRTILTTRNPVANQKAARYTGPTTAPTYTVAPAVGMTPYVRTPVGTYPNEPTPPAPPKVSINTAEFGELWRGFWSVMVGDNNNVPMQEDLEFYAANSVAPARRGDDPVYDPYHGQGFAPIAPNANVAAVQHPARQFRSSVRDTRSPLLFNANSGARIQPNQMMLLRSAIAAVNAQDLRDSDFEVSEQTITLQVRIDNQGTPSTPGGPNVVDCPVTVYGTERQPFISEVYVNTDTITGGPLLSNPNGYIAIELSNPYPDPIMLGPATAGVGQGWTVGMIDRRRPQPAPNPPITVPRPQLRVEPIDPLITPEWRFPAGTVIPAATAAGPGKLLLENYDQTNLHPERARSRPAELALAPTSLPATDPTPRTDCVFVPGLHRVLNGIARDISSGGEFVLLRTRSSVAISVNIPGLNETSSRTLHDLIPVDQFDFTGASRPADATGPFLWMHYVRENGPGFEWRHVYPGRYDGNQTSTFTQAPPFPDSRHQGVQMFVLDPNAGLVSPPVIQKPVALLQPDVTIPVGAYLNPFTIQLANKDFGGPNKIPLAPANQFPFGTFARNGDILQVPFIGAYTIEYGGAGRVTNPYTGILEMNSISMDSVFAEDTDVNDDPVVGAATFQDHEQIGRFYPISHNPPRGGPGSQQVDDFYVDGEYYNFPDATSVDNPTLQPHVAQWRYQWAEDLLEYFTVQAPNDDFFPNVSPVLYPAPDPTPVANTGGTAGNSTPETPANTANDHAEDARGVDGLININTAGWRVISMLPMAVNNAGVLDIADNNELAKAIVYWRDVDALEDDPTKPWTVGNQPHGPFRNLQELQEVVDLRPATQGGPNPPPVAPARRPGVRDANGTLDLSPGGADPGDAAGDVSPFDVPGPAGTDLVRGDFEETTLTLNRISNLVTTRSDMFTCYLLVQGWRDAGTANASLVVQRRVAFIVDRSETTPTANPQAKVTYVPNN